MFLVFLHQFVGVRQENGRTKEGQVNVDLPLDVLGRHIRHVDEGFEEMDARNPDQGCGKFNLDGAGIDMALPIRTVGMTVEIELADKRRIAADHDHREKVRHHGDVDQGQNAEHEDCFG